MSEHADTATEGVRALTHATDTGQCELRGPGDANIVLSSLASLVHRLRQTLDQLAGSGRRGSARSVRTVRTPGTRPGLRPAPS